MLRHAFNMYSSRSLHLWTQNRWNSSVRDVHSDMKMAMFELNEGTDFDLVLSNRAEGALTLECQRRTRSTWIFVCPAGTGFGDFSKFLIFLWPKWSASPSIQKLTLAQ